MVNTNKFDETLPCDLEPFGYIEDRKVLVTKNSGTLMMISFGALNHLGHYAPEFGGVALVHLNPNILICMTYIPWDSEARKAELNDRYLYLQNNHENMSPQDVSDYFFEDCYYIQPAMKQRLKEEYFLQVAEKNKERAVEMKEDYTRQLSIQASAMVGVDVAAVLKSVEPRTPEQVRRDVELSGEELEEEEVERIVANRTEYVQPKFTIVKKEAPEETIENEVVEAAITFKGEELISLEEE